VIEDDIWDILDIAPTADTRAIRRAYAHRYRQTEDELDADGLARLRGARDAALDHAGRWSAMDEAPPLRGDDDASAGVTTATRDTEDPLADDNASKAVDYDSQFQALWSLLFDDDADDDDDDDDDRLRQAFGRHFDIVLSDPRISEIEYYAQAEQWFAALLARTSPRSDAVLARVVDRFKWMDQAGEVGQAPAIAFLTGRRRLLGFFDDIRDPKHRLHPAWRELTTPANESSRRGWRVGKKKVRELLSLVRRDYPPLEQQFDWYRVSMWENPNSFAMPTGFGIVFVIVLLQFLRFGMMPDTSEPSPQQFVPPVIELASGLTTPQADIRDALDEISDGMLDVDLIEGHNPELYRSLELVWDDSEANSHRKSQFTAAIGDSLDARFRRVVVKANHANLAALVRNRMDQAKFFRNLGAIHCVQYLRGTLAAAISATSDLRREARMIRFRILADTRGDAPEPKANGTYWIPGSVIADSARRLGMTHDEFMKAMNDDTSARRECDTEIALRQTALQLPPKKGMKLLRYM